MRVPSGPDTRNDGNGGPLAQGELLQFCVLFILVFFGFVMAFNLAFSGTVFKFRTITQTFYSLFQVRRSGAFTLMSRTATLTKVPF